METPHGASPPEDLRSQLDQLQSDEARVIYPPLPRWFFMVQAAVMAGMFLAELLPGSDTMKLRLALVVVALVPAVRWWILREEAHWPDVPLRDLAPLVLLVTATLVGCAILAGPLGAWIWAAGAAVAATAVLVVGYRYERQFGRG